MNKNKVIVLMLIIAMLFVYMPLMDHASALKVVLGQTYSTTIQNGLNNALNNTVSGDNGIYLLIVIIVLGLVFLVFVTAPSKSKPAHQIRREGRRPRKKNYVSSGIEMVEVARRKKKIKW